MSDSIYQYHIVYKTTNTVTNKFYIGVHSTNNLNDDYLGSGINLTRSIKKYGRDSFSREILFTFSSRDEASRKEREVVNEDFVNRRDTYNMSVGGLGYTGNYKRGREHHWWGKRHTQETIEKMSRTKKGNKSKTGRTGKLHPLYGLRKSEAPQSKKAMVNGVIYNSCTEAAEACGITRSTFSYWIKTGKATKL